MLLIITLALASLLTACSNPPSEAEARKAFENDLNGFSGGLFRVSSFKKTNALSGKMFAIKSYVIEFEAQVEYLRDYVDRLSDPSNPRTFKKGQVQKVTGSIRFEETEKGWRPKPAKWRFNP